jgi:hypothetical protein
MRDHFVTRSGLPVRIVGDHEDPNPPSGSRRSALRAYTEGSPEHERAIVELAEYNEIKEWLRTEHQISLEADYPSVLRTIVLYALEHLDDYKRDEHGNILVTLESADLKALLWPRRLQDRQLRVFLARRIYDEVSRRTLRDPVAIDKIDCAVCGATLQDFVRAGQILEEEGYLEMGPTPSDAVMVRARATLIRDVERYGAPKLDSAAAEDLVAALAAYPVAKERLESITLEYRRFTTATTHQELVSVFKAIAPEVEGLARAVLQARGVSGSFGSLGSIIREFATRGLGSLGLVSQLRYVQKFARDAIEHGETLPDTVLRIACANAFELLPQLAALSA